MGTNGNAPIVVYGTPNGTTTVIVANVGAWPFEKRLGQTLEITMSLVAPAAANELAGIVSPGSLATIAAVLVAWIASHAFGLGEIIDIILGAVGLIAVGWAILDAIDHLYEFASGVYGAKQMQDLHKAAQHLAKAIAIIGIQAVLAVLFKGAKQPKGGRVPVETPPVANGWRYKPNGPTPAKLEPGIGGETNIWGDIRISSSLSGPDKARVILHEKLHQFLSPKLVVLRKFRASNLQGSYSRSSLWRYIEEALAETIAQVGVNGIKQLLYGIRFPVEKGYLYLRQAGGVFPSWGGAGLIPEAKGLLKTAVVSGVGFELLFYESSTLGNADAWYEGLYKEYFAGDTDIRNWVKATGSAQLSSIEPGMKASLVSRLLDGWVSDDDVDAVKKICDSIDNQEEGRFISGVMLKQRLHVGDIGQRITLDLLIQRY